MTRNDHGVSTVTIIAIVALALAVLVGIFVLHQHNAVSRRATAGERPPALSAEQQAYLPLLVLSDLRMSAATNYLGDTVTYLDGSVANQGTKPVRRIEVELNFVDPFRQVVLRENARPLADRSKPLGPGESCAFRVSFEHMPADWNQAPPNVRPVFVEF